MPPRSLPTPKRLAPALIVVVIAMLGVAESATVHAAAPARPTVIITGNVAISTDSLRRTIGRAPRRSSRWPAWTKNVRRRLLKAYGRAGYSIARAWTRLDFKSRRIDFHIDEGRVAWVEVRGGGLVARFIARRELALPHGAYHVPTVKEAMRRLRQATPTLQNAYVRVVTSREMVATPLGTLVNKRFLRVFAVSREPAGLQFSAALSPRFGLDLALGYAHPNALAERDRLAVGLTIAAPFRRYVYETEVNTRWVAGGLSLAYRVHPDPKSAFAVAFSSAGGAWRDSRQDAGYLNTLDARWEGRLGVAYHGIGPLTWRSQLGAHYRHSLLRIPIPGSPYDVAPVRQWRLQWKNSLEIDVRPTILQPADANRIRLDTLLNITPDGEVSGRVDLNAQVVVNAAPHQLRLALAGFSNLGRSYFFDMETVAGPLQRAYFGGRFWTHRKASFEIAYRARLGRSLQLGLFHDLTVFHQRLGSTSQATLVNAVGPSANLTFLGLVAIDVSYAFGFVLHPRRGPLRWAHNLTFRLSSAF